MSIWSFARAADGVFTGRQFVGSEQLLEANTPADCLAVEGAHDATRVRLDLDTGQPVAWQPPAPPSDALTTWVWSALDHRWLPQPTAAALEAAARTERDRLLAACDWVVTRATEAAQAVPAVWVAYRQALRDVPEQPGFPTTINWPAAPE